MWYDKMSDLSNMVSVLETIKLRRYIDHLAVSDRVYMLARRGVGANAGGCIIGGRKAGCAAVDNTGAGKTLDISDSVTVRKRKSYMSISIDAERSNFNKPQKTKHRARSTFCSKASKRLRCRART